MTEYLKFIVGERAIITGLQHHPTWKHLYGKTFRIDAVISEYVYSIRVKNRAGIPEDLHIHSSYLGRCSDTNIVDILNRSI